MDKIRVLVADDHPAFREGLCRLLGDEKDMDVVGMAADGEEAIRLAKELGPDVAILDVTMPGLNGIGAARQIKAARPQTAILMVSAYDYESYVLASLRAGAVGYLLKSTSLQDLITAVRLVHSGAGVFDAKAIGKIARRLGGDEGEEQKDFHGLHPRELEVIRLAAKGASNKEIATELVVSERTVQAHMVNIFKKLGVDSRTEAVLRALKEGWLILSDLS